MRIVNKVTAEADQAARNLAQGDNVKQDEVIAVEPNSLGELRLNDETKLALGPGSKMKLDKFVYDPNKATGTIAVDLTKGAFRFISGVAQKNSYLIRSPNASISVRGTVFDVYVAPDGTMWVLLHEGAIEICNANGRCKSANNPCGIVRVGGGGDLDRCGHLEQPTGRARDRFRDGVPVRRAPAAGRSGAALYARQRRERQLPGFAHPPTPPIRRAEGPAPAEPAITTPLPRAAAPPAPAAPVAVAAPAAPPASPPSHAAGKRAGAVVPATDRRDGRVRHAWLGRRAMWA